MQIEGRTWPQLDRGLIAGLVDPAIRILQRNKYLHALLIGNERFEPEPASATREERPVPFAAFWRNSDKDGAGAAPVRIDLQPGLTASAST